MAGVGWIIMGIGFAIQVLVPVGIFGRPMGLIFGVPTQLAFVFGGTWILVIGLIIVYNTWLMPYAKQLDSSVDLDS
ncbi:MAG: hypothetical protein OXP66_16430 [Candidatus Tectomicrobia bacterium]|nr:hypothetical protein [Candidatus Tectomicrobia bacterium]